MKKFLLATTALALSASVAAAEVKVTGDGRMGIVYDGETANFNSRIRAFFTMSGETDGGLAFGGTFRADQTNSTDGSGGTIFISGAFGKLSMGDTDGGAEKAVGDLSNGVGYSNPSSVMAWYETEYIIDAQSGDPLALYQYTAGDFGFHFALTDGTSGGYLGGTTSGVNEREGYSVGLTYKFGDFGIAAGYESLKRSGSSVAANLQDREDQWLIAGTAVFGDAKIKAFYAQGSAYSANGTAAAIDDFDQYGVSLDYKFGATTVTAFYRELSFDTVGDATYYGIGAAYALGGGATLKGGIMNVDRAAGASIDIGGPNYGYGAFDDTVADFGITFTF